MAIITGISTTRADVIEVTTIVYNSNKILTSDWFQVDNNKIPEMTGTDPGKQMKMMYNQKTKRLYTEVVDRKLTDSELKDIQIQELKTMLEDATNILLDSGVL